MGELRTGAPGSAGPSPRVVRRSWLSIRWRQFRNAPQPILRAVLANLTVAAVAGVVLLALDIANGRGAGGGDLVSIAFVCYILLVVVAGSVFTYLWVPLPSGASGRRRRTLWAGMLGFFASLPIAYLVLVVAFQVIRPLIR